MRFQSPRNAVPTTTTLPGTVCFTMKKTIPLEERFWPKVDKSPGKGPNGDCWLWTGCKLPKGYGQIGIANVPALAHRVSYELANGPIPEGLHVLHACDNPSCVNPTHLLAGTPKDNMQDMISKGRKKNGFDGRTHCKKGHEFTPENSKFVINQGGRVRLCYACLIKRWAKDKANRKVRQNVVSC